MLAEQAVTTPLTRQLDRLSKQILVIGGIALVASMALNLARGDTFIATFNAAVAFAIAAIPVALPMVVTTILAWGTERLAKVGAIMKRLPSTETLGSTSAINTDKTGTLTLNQLTAVQMTAAGRRYAVDGKGYSTAGRITRVAGEADIGLDEVLMPMVLASDAVVRDGELIGDRTEGALVVLAAKGGIDAVSTRERYPRIAELPFDAAYKLMATFHTMTGASGQQVIRCFVKGAPDQLLARAATVADADAGPVPADGEVRQRYLAENQRLGEQGLRVIAIARTDFDPATFDPGADLEATQAWNLHTALYYKAGGIPWRLPRDPADLDTCYVGITFYYSADQQTLQTSVAQVFNQRGDGVIVRGAPAKVSRNDRQPHLAHRDAESLLTEALRRYRSEHGNLPARAVLHKTSSYTPDEITGFRTAADDADIRTLEMLWLPASDPARLFRPAQHPPLRGTLLSLDDRRHVLYTRGSVPFYGTYPGMYIPSPLPFRLVETKSSLSTSPTNSSP